MSFSKSFRGRAAAVLAILAAAAAEQKTTDEAGGASPGVINGHAKQIEAGVTAVTAMIAAAPEGSELQGSVWGHANADESGSYGCSLQVSGLATDPVPTGD